MRSHTKIFLITTVANTINSASSLYFITNYINGYIEASNGNKYFALVPTKETKDTLKKYEKLWNKIRDLIRSITNTSDNFP